MSEQNNHYQIEIPFSSILKAELKKIVRETIREIEQERKELNDQQWKDYFASGNTITDKLNRGESLFPSQTDSVKHS